MFNLFYRLNRSIRRFGHRLQERGGRIAAAAIWPIERAFAATFGRVFRMLEGFDRVEDWLLGFVRLVTWPIRAIWRVIAAIASRIVPRSVRQVVAKQARSIFRLPMQLGAALWRLAERLNLDGALRRLVWVLQPLWRPVAAILGFAYAWLLTRPYRKMAWGLPIIVILFPILGSVVWAKTLGQESVKAQYILAISEAKEAKDAESLRLFERKLIQMGVDTQHSDFLAAEKLAESDIEEAYERMKLLAPESESKYAPAHYWIFLQLMDQRLDVAEADRLRLAGVHLEHLKVLGSTGPHIELMEALWLGQSGKLEEAVEKLKTHTSRSPLAAMQRFQINMGLGRLDDARTDAQFLIPFLQEQREEARQAESEKERKERRLSQYQYQAWAQAEQLLRNQANMARVIREWYAEYPDDQAAAENVVALDLAEFSTILASTRPEASALTDRLVEAARLMKEPAELERPLRDLYKQRRFVPALATMFAGLIDSADTPLPLVSAIGTCAALDNDVVLARKLLARVVEADPENSVALNNYAWVLAKEPEPDLPAALKYVNRALELSPDEYRFRETRGQILVTLGRWREAVDDLDVALNGIPDSKDVHRALAIAYEKLGETDLATLHRQHAN